MFEKLDYEQLRNDLIDYYGTAIANGFPVAIIELNDVENASLEKLVQIAVQNGYDLNNYLVKRL